MILPLMAVIVLQSASAYPWDDPKLDLMVDVKETAWKERELTVSIKSCDDVQKTCIQKNRISYVPISITVNEIVDDDRIFVENYTTKTEKGGDISYPIYINSKFKSHAFYEVVVTGTHDGITDTERLEFWTHEKHY